MGKVTAWRVNAAPPGMTAPIAATKPTAAHPLSNRSTRRHDTQTLSRRRYRGVAALPPRPDGWSADQGVRRLRTEIEESQRHPGKDEHAAADRARRREAGNESEGEQRGQRRLAEKGERHRHRVDVTEGPVVDRMA